MLVNYCGRELIRSAQHLDADPDSYFYLMRIRIRLFTLTRIRRRIQILALNKGPDHWKSAQVGLIFHSPLACHLEIDADPVPDPAYHFDADPDPGFLFDADADPGYQNDVDPCGSGSTTPLLRYWYLHYVVASGRGNHQILFLLFFHLLSLLHGI